MFNDAYARYSAPSMPDVRERAPISWNNNHDKNTDGGDGMVERLIKWIVDRDQPFSEVDAPSFRNLIRLLSPAAKVPSNDTVNDNCACFACSHLR